MIRRFVFVLLVLCLPSLACGQQFNVLNTSLYPDVGTEFFIPDNDNQAILVWRVEPRGNYSNVVSASIVPSFSPSNTTSRLYNSPYGFSINQGTISVDGFSSYWTIIDSSNIYLRYGNISTATLLGIQNILASKNLGTVQQRAAYIAGFKVKDVKIVDTAQIMQNFQDLLGPWATIAVGFAIALFCLELGTRNTKQLAGDAAKEARASDRRVVNREIRDDPIAGQFRAHMDNLASVMRNTYGFHDASTRAQARDLFEQAARDYASYKKSRGWTV